MLEYHGELSTLDDYYIRHVIPCTDCSKDEDIMDFMTYRKLPNFVGNQNNQYQVLILGHSPSVRTASTPKRCKMESTWNSDARFVLYLLIPYLLLVDKDLSTLIPSSDVFQRFD